MVTRLYAILAILFLMATAASAQSYLKHNGYSCQLIVDNRPMLILGGELGNSSASSAQDIERIFPKLQRMGLNTVLVPAYWDLLEPQEGSFDFSLTDKVIAQAKTNNLKVVFLWFGAWKNSMSCYTPLWFKRDFTKYPRVHTASGKPLEIASPFSKNVLNADSRAFKALLSHIAVVDKSNTVIMVQIENEIGMLESARDFSSDANQLYNSKVPTQLVSYLINNMQTLHPYLKSKCGKHIYKTDNTWADLFGPDIYTEEIFMAYHFATYVEQLAQIARATYNVPLFVNAAMNSRGRKPGEYPSAGPLAHLIDIWHCAAPSIDFLSPDIYDKGFADWTSQYKLHNNPLFIPEMRLSNANGVQAFYVFGEHEAIGVSPFSIENGSDDNNSTLTQAYATLSQLMPLLAQYAGRDATKGLLFDADNTERIIYQDQLKITCRHFFTLPWDARATNGSEWPAGGGLILRLAANEYIVAGCGVVVTFENNNETNAKLVLGEDGFANNGNEKTEHDTWTANSRIGIGSVDEITIDDNGNINFLRRLNGDEDHQGRHVRIGVDDFKILHVKLYEYK